MRYLDTGGNEITAHHWYILTGSLGMGQVLAETTMPHLLGEITLRTVFLGMREDNPDPRPYHLAVLPYRTMRLLVGRAYWETMETYDGDVAARAGHLRWCVRLANSAAGDDA